MRSRTLLSLAGSLAVSLIYIAPAIAQTDCHTSCPPSSSSSSSTVVAPVINSGSTRLELMSEQFIPLIGRSIQSSFQGPQFGVAGLQLDHVGLAAGNGLPPLQAWAALNGGHTIDAHPGATQNIASVAGSVGLETKLSPNFLLGMTVAPSGSMGSVSPALRSEGTSVSVGPYAGYQLSPAWNLFAAGGYGWNDSILRSPIAGGAAGSFSGNTWYINGGLNGGFAYNNFNLAPNVSVLYTEQTNDPYTNTAGVAVGGSTSRLGRVSMGGSVIGPTYGYVQPFVRAALEVDFQQARLVSTITGATINPSSTGGVLGGGVNLNLGTGTTATIDASYDTIGRDRLYGWSARARLNFAL